LIGGGAVEVRAVEVRAVEVRAVEVRRRCSRFRAAHPEAIIFTTTAP
jgi:hypothetical protein